MHGNPTKVYIKPNIFKPKNTNAYRVCDNIYVSDLFIENCDGNITKF